MSIYGNEGRQYMFLRVDEQDVTVKITDNLDEFRTFNHYWSLIEDDNLWDEEKEVIVECCDNGGYIANGNDVHYYIISHPTWISEFLDGTKIDIKVE